MKIGTAGWDYEDWIGPFYPKTLERSKYLKYFSKYFDIVEINSTFYNLPSREMVNNWNKRVPENFCFIVKVWQNITHNLNDPDLDANILEFLIRMDPLKKKIAGFLLQFPPWLKYSEKHFHKINSVLKEFPDGHRLIIELRDNSWFKTEILSQFTNGDRIVIGTTYMPGVIPYYMPEQNYYYIRLIGDRELNVFNRIQRDQKEALDDLYKNLQNLTKRANIYEIFVIVNNHFQGNAPESVNNIKKILRLPYRTFNHQRSIADFL